MPRASVPGKQAVECVGSDVGNKQSAPSKHDLSHRHWRSKAMSWNASELVTGYCEIQWQVRLTEVLSIGVWWMPSRCVNEQLEALPFPSLQETTGPTSRAFPREMAMWRSRDSAEADECLLPGRRVEHLILPAKGESLSMTF